MYTQLQKESDAKDNIFFGPASIYSALAMVYTGTGGSTSDELKKLLDLPEEDSAEFFRRYADLFDKVIASVNRGCLLDVANRIWVKKNQPIEQEYMAKIKEYYKADAAMGIDFFGDVEGSRMLINQWIEDQTKQKICNMLKPKSLLPSTNFLVTSAMYFLGNWRNEFKESNTKKVPFYAPGGEVIDVEMMYQKTTLGYHENEHYDCKVGVIPYKDSDLRMIIVLPNERDGLPELERRFAQDEFNGEYMFDWTDLNPNRDVHIHLPKFKVSKKFDLVDSMRQLGVNRLFDCADLRGMTSTRDLIVNGVAHASYIDCNEKGTEVAVVTCSGFVKAGISKNYEVKCDHPFLYWIGDAQNEVILFMGRVTKPEYA